jgi:hypothetical protein
MKFSDITGNDVSTLTEAPMGFMSTLKTGLQSMNPFSLSGRAQAQGKLVAGLDANNLYKSYYQYLGSQGKQQPDTDSVIAFLQQSGYGKQAITAAQSKFPQVPQQPAANATQPPDYSGGRPPAVAPTKVNYSGMPQPKPLPKATSGQGAYSAKNPYATPAASKPTGPTQAELDADNERMASGTNENIHIREATALNKQQLSAIFTAVAQSGAAPAAASQNTGNRAASNDVGGQQSSSNNNASSSRNNTNSSSRNSATSNLPVKLNPEQLLQYYTNLPNDDRAKVKTGIADIDKKLAQNQQTR